MRFIVRGVESTQEAVHLTMEAEASDAVRAGKLSLEVRKAFVAFDFQVGQEYEVQIVRTA